MLGSRLSIWPKAKNASRVRGKLARCWRFGIAICVATFWQLDNAQSQEPKSNHYRQWAFIQLNDNDQFNCLDELWFKESRWNPKAQNGSHYGIPQGKSEYLKRVDGFKQVEWGLNYVRARYGTPCLALVHHNAKGWY